MVKLSLYLRKLVPSKELYDRDRVLKAILEKTDFKTMDEVEATYGKNCIDQIFKENNSIYSFFLVQTKEEIRILLHYYSWYEYEETSGIYFIQPLHAPPTTVEDAELMSLTYDGMITFRETINFRQCKRLEWLGDCGFMDNPIYIIVRCNLVEVELHPDW
jgi:hypothetical protein